MNLKKRIGGKRHREWAWALVLIALCTAAVAMWGSQEPSSPAATTQGTNKPAVSGPAAAKDTTVAGVLAGIPEASAFNAYFVANRISTGGAGPYTLFVPSNAAFGTLAKGTVSGLAPAAQKRLVEYHVVAGKELSTSAIKTGTYQALSKDYLNFEVNLETGASYVNSGKILATYQAQNGVVYLISSVLFPPKQ